MSWGWLTFAKIFSDFKDLQDESERKKNELAIARINLHKENERKENEFAKANFNRIIPSSVLINRITDGTILLLRSHLYSSQDQGLENTIINLGSQGSQIALNGTSGNEAHLSKGRFFVMKDVKFSGGKGGNEVLSCRLISDDSTLNDYQLIAKFILTKGGMFFKIKFKTIGDIRKDTDNLVSFYYGEGQGHSLEF